MPATRHDPGPRSGSEDPGVASTGEPTPQPVAWRVALPPALLVTVLLTATSNRYGYHRDELYFRMLQPAWGHLDQPPLAPLLARTLSAVVDEPWALRIPATVSLVLFVLVTTLLTGELGGGPGAQRLTAWGSAFGALPLAMAHTLLTSALDLAVWPAVVLCATRALLRRAPRWWLLAGLVAGLSTYDKFLVAVLVAALAAALLCTGRHRVLASPLVWGGALLGLLVALPNLAYQATHGWPQLDVGAALGAANGAEVRTAMWPMLLVLLGPAAVPVWVVGWVCLARRPGWRPVRFLSVALGLVLVLVFAMGSQPCYPLGMLAVVFAAGSVPVAEWRAGHRGRRRVVTGAAAANAVVSIVIALPVLPADLLARTPVPEVNQVARDTLGWPEYVRQVAGVYAGLPADERARAVVVTANYGEAGAVARYGPALGLPAVHSGHNALADATPPPRSATVAVYVGFGERAREAFATCAVVARLDSGLGVDTEEQGEPVAICRDPVGGWEHAWPRLRHVD